MAMASNPVPWPGHRSAPPRTRSALVSLASCAALVLHPPPSQALAFDWLGGQQQQQQQQEQRVERDPVEPFTIYGSIFKKYFIEQIVEGKIVARRKGFTASACMNVLEASLESPELQAVPAGLKVTLLGEPCCGKGEGQSREESCSQPCSMVCKAAIARHLRHVNETTGYVLDPDDTKRVIGSCVNQCSKECTKPGKSISFVLPFRPRK
ncbi:uncharacterized protein LOC112340884 [Selaginella moellendorffii]|uniref:uncharacterized protein LOC112340884 n=1 Tax=Selaginella moellendorffii TaxID=88036 RepID=UPI000D1C553B|nr:uncharacterized protein LOC112340884 [Selaginella moellendorffii]|eukprot:XP_024515811.1 uncharacterized protein LOC112340884 [Selaginella moellendorffii]